MVIRDGVSEAEFGQVFTVKVLSLLPHQFPEIQNIDPPFQCLSCFLRISKAGQ